MSHLNVDLTMKQEYTTPFCEPMTLVTESSLLTESYKEKENDNSNW